jgi:DNA-binding CsgD family transcriptional regulator
LARVRAILEDEPWLRADPDILLRIVESLVDTRADTTEIDAMLETTEAAARDHSLGTLPRALIQIAWRRLAQGAWDDARIAAFEAGQLFDETGQRGGAAEAEAALAFLAAQRGETTACEDHLATVRQIAVHRADLARATSDRVLGALALAIGDARTAVVRLEPIVGERTLVPSRSVTVVDLIDALVRSGASDDAETHIAGIEAFNEPLSPVCSAWALALIGGNDQAFADALRALDTLAFDRPPIRARIELGRGERLRRAGERKAARTALRAALEIFERLDAHPWSARARDELAATGEKVRPRNAGLSDELTPRELQVARLIAAGDTYKEASARLFLSAKTVEFHLGKVYRKLGISARRELALALEHAEEDR